MKMFREVLTIVFMLLGTIYSYKGDNAKGTYAIAWAILIQLL